MIVAARWKSLRTVEDSVPKVKRLLHRRAWPNTRWGLLSLCRLTWVAKFIRILKNDSPGIFAPDLEQFDDRFRGLDHFFEAHPFEWRVRIVLP